MLPACLLQSNSQAIQHTHFGVIPRSTVGTWYLTSSPGRTEGTPPCSTSHVSPQRTGSSSPPRQAAKQAPTAGRHTTLRQARSRLPQTQTCASYLTHPWSPQAWTRHSSSATGSPPVLTTSQRRDGASEANGGHFSTVQQCCPWGASYDENTVPKLVHCI